jgi:hypothetical protein
MRRWSAATPQDPSGRQGFAITHSQSPVRDGPGTKLATDPKKRYFQLQIAPEVYANNRRERGREAS